MWKAVERPGYFGRRRDEKIAAFDAKFGKGNWKLVWLWGDLDAYQYFEFFEACRSFYEESYLKYLKDRPDDINFICTFGQCYDNAVSNTQSGLDYMVQEAYSTHIQDIAIRNVLRRLGRWFEGPTDKLLQIRSKDSEGFRFGPGNVPFYAPSKIGNGQGSLCPTWANEGSVEDFWQSNKWLMARY